MNTVSVILDRKGRSVVSADESITVYEAARIMAANRIGCLIVTGGSGGVEGLLSERDIVFRLLADGLDPRAVLVREIMTAPVACCQPDTPLENCSAVMTQERLRQLPVVEDGELCGIISSGDILALQAREKEATLEFLQEYLCSHV